MKKLLFLSFLALSLITFTACGAGPIVEAPEEGGKTLTPGETEVIDDSNTPETSDATDPNELVSIYDEEIESAIDRELLNTAVESRDGSQCGQILDETIKEECKLAVEDFSMQDEAIAASDLSKCEEVKSDRLRDNCTESIEEALEIAAQAEDQQEAEVEADNLRLQIEGEAIQAGDPNICNKIEDENFKFSCRFNIIANEAYQANDPSLCDTIGKSDFVENCKIGIGADERP